MTRTLEQHLFGPGKKRILSLDGGGVRGIVSIAFLERMEQLLAAKTGQGDKFRLCHFFDMIGGTSVGSMIATMLVLGYRVSEVKERFSAWAPEIFKGRRGYFGNRFDARELTNRVRGIVSERTLESQDLLTGLTVVAKRTDTGSVWALANNRKLPFWNDGPTKGNKPEWRGNRYYKLEHLIRASTAAPYFFTPASIPIVEGEPDGQFVDGGVSPHNNPSLLLLMMAGINAYQLSWAMGDDNLLMISVGTGRYRVRLKKEGRGPGRVLPGFALDTFASLVAGEARRDLADARFAVQALRGLVADGETLVLTMMQWLATSSRPWAINLEIGDLKDDLLARDRSGNPHAMLRFQRYDIELEDKWLRQHLKTEIDDNRRARLQNFDDASIINDCYELAANAAKSQVQANDFEGFID